jgi:hypothetical protein
VVRCSFAAIFHSRTRVSRNIPGCLCTRAAATSMQARKRPSFAAIRFASGGDTIIKVLLDPRC